MKSVRLAKIPLDPMLYPLVKLHLMLKKPSYFYLRVCLCLCFRTGEAPYLIVNPSKNSVIPPEMAILRLMLPRK